MTQWSHQKSKTFKTKRVEKDKLENYQVLQSPHSQTIPRRHQ